MSVADSGEGTAAVGRGGRVAALGVLSEAWEAEDCSAVAVAYVER